MEKTEIERLGEELEKEIYIVIREIIDIVEKEKKDERRKIIDKIDKLKELYKSKTNSWILEELKKSLSEDKI